jgi:hypothetical protein
MLTPIKQLFEKFTLRPETIAKSQKIAFKIQRFSIVIFLTHKVLEGLRGYMILLCPSIHNLYDFFKGIPYFMYGRSTIFIALYYVEALFWCASFGNCYPSFYLLTFFFCLSIFISLKLCIFLYSAFAYLFIVY